MVEKSSPRLFGRKWTFRVFCATVTSMTRQAIAENGRKWQKMDFRGKMAGNGFSRFLRQSPTTIIYAMCDVIDNQQGL